MIKHAKMSISEPWETGETMRWPVFNGELHFEGNSSFGIFCFQNPISYYQKTYPIAVVSGRYGNFTLGDSDSQCIIPCTVICVPSEEIADPVRFAQKWRGGGLTFMGTIIVS